MTNRVQIYVDKADGTCTSIVCDAEELIITPTWYYEATGARMSFEISFSTSIWDGDEPVMMIHDQRLDR